jgi:hypothetical protein
MNPLDRKLATVFKALLKGAQDEQKRQKASKEFGQIRERVVDERMPPGTERWLPWQQTGDGLQRLATAVGGANVILQHASEGELSDAHPVRREPLVLVQIGYVTCRCQGGHKDCMFCNGRGEIMQPSR